MVRIPAQVTPGGIADVPWLVNSNLILFKAVPIAMLPPGLTLGLVILISVTAQS
jgi:hypothetical protein